MTTNEQQINPILIESIENIRKAIWAIDDICSIQRGYDEGSIMGNHIDNIKIINECSQKIAETIANIASQEIVNKYFYLDDSTFSTKD